MSDKNGIEEIDPGEILTEEMTPKYPVARRGISIDQIATMTPQQATQIMQIRIDSLIKIRKAAIQGTSPQDWVGFKDRDDNVTYLLASSGAVKIRKYYGISTFNIRPESPEIIDDGGGRYASIMVDALCNLTGEIALNITGLRRAGEDFVGRKTDEDLKMAARTSAETKAVRILAGMIRVPESELVECEIDVSKTRKGAGFGKSAEREAGRVTTDEVKALQEVLKKKLVQYTGGDMMQMDEVLKNITKNPNPKSGKPFAGFDSVSKMTMDWQLTGAIDKLDILMKERG